MVFDNGKGVARNEVRGYVDVRENGAERCREYGDSPVTLRKVSLAEQRARDAVGYGVHKEIETEAVYTIQQGARDLCPDKAKIKTRGRALEWQQPQT
jgi:hypothetical protein